MERNYNFTKIDPVKLDMWVKSSGYTQTAISHGIGYGNSFLSAAKSRGTIHNAALFVLQQKYGLNPEDIYPDPPKPEPVKEEPKQELVMGYHLDLQVHATKVKLSLMFNDEVVESAWAKILGNGEIDLVKSISYAAHMIYKHVEQNVLEHEA